MTEFFQYSISVRVGKPVHKLLRELVKDERKRPYGIKDASESTLVRIAIIGLARDRLGGKADRIISEGVLLE